MNGAARLWRSLGNYFPRGSRRKLAAENRLAEAYREVFKGENGELVLADLANESGNWRYSLAANTTSEELWQNEGKRKMFLHIFSRLAMTEADIRALETAARREAAIDADPLESTE